MEAYVGVGVSVDLVFLGQVGTVKRDTLGPGMVVNTRKELCGAFINR